MIDHESAHILQFTKAVPLYGRLAFIDHGSAAYAVSFCIDISTCLHDDAALQSEAGALTSTCITSQVQQQVRITFAAPECSVPDLVQAARHHSVSAFPCQCQARSSSVLSSAHALHQAPATGAVMRL